MAPTAAGSPKISAQEEKLLLELTMIEAPLVARADPGEELNNPRRYSLAENHLSSDC